MKITVVYPHKDLSALLTADGSLSPSVIEGMEIAIHSFVNREEGNQLISKNKITGVEILITDSEESDEDKNKT